MQIIKQSEVNIAEIVDALKQGKVIVYPTETCYGLGCDATNQATVKRLFEIKKRQLEKTALVLVPSVEAITQYIEWTPTLEKLSEKYWPGPLTLVVKMKNGASLPAGVMGADHTIAFRITDHYFAMELCERFGGPLVSTSANISQYNCPYDLAGILAMFGKADKQPDIIIDGGVLPQRNPSTVARVSGDKIEVIRQGDIHIT